MIEFWNAALHLLQNPSKLCRCKFTLKTR